MPEPLPVIRSIAGDEFVFHQDNAPAHCTCDTVELLRCETPQIISSDMWPANSCDLDPVDHCILGRDADVCIPSTNLRYRNDLWQQLVETWANFQQSVMDDAIDQW